MICTTNSHIELHSFRRSRHCHCLGSRTAGCCGMSSNRLKQVNPRLKIEVREVFSYFSIKMHVVGTRKNRLVETVLSNAQNMCLIS